MVRLLVLTILTAFSISACQSRRIDKPIQELPGAKDFVNKQKVTASRFEIKIESIVQSVDKFKGLYDRALKVLLKQTGMTPVDVLIVLLRSAQKGVSTVEGEVSTKLGRIELPFISPKDPCRYVDTEITSRAADGHDAIEIRVETCVSKAPEVLIEASWQGKPDGTMKMNLGPIEAVYRKASGGTEMLQQDCSIVAGTGGDIKSVECKNLRFALSSDEDLLIHVLTYVAGSEIPGSGRVSIRHKNGTIREDVSFVIPKDGIPKRVDPTGETAEAAR